jgi:hypothetical protein
VLGNKGDTGKLSLPDDIREKYEIHQRKHAIAILSNDFPEEWNDLLQVLSTFRLRKSAILTPGGRKSPIAVHLDEMFSERGWKEKRFDISLIIEGEKLDTPTHSVDYCKNGIAIEVEWNNKDPFFDRDLNNFRLLHDLHAISVGVIVTRSDELQEVFDALGKGDSYGQSTTHMSKLLPKINGGGAGGCPLLVFGITKRSYSSEE